MKWRKLAYFPLILFAYAVCFAVDGAAQDSSRPTRVGDWRLEYIQSSESADLRAVGGRDFHLIYTCLSRGEAILGLAFWGPDITGDGPNDTRQFTFIAGQKKETFQLSTPRGGVYHFRSQDRRAAMNLISSVKELSVKFIGLSGEQNVDFQTERAGEAFAAVGSRCPG
ncbi:hypothetical protein [Bradyrhizobium japonicum]|uniref:hypothetical protein n=1 Tax=Bradyrhizobium japonicum TaxID=375 RepID=UPI0012BB6A98|nr:hypothetical protein [Bradyrhizobium japonicum]